MVHFQDKALESNLSTSLFSLSVNEYDMNNATNTMGFQVFAGIGGGAYCVGAKLKGSGTISNLMTYKDHGTFLSKKSTDGTRRTWEQPNGQEISRWRLVSQIGPKSLVYTGLRIVDIMHDGGMYVVR
jgi:hypothetical protein